MTETLAGTTVDPRRALLRGEIAAPETRRIAIERGEDGPPAARRADVLDAMSGRS